MRASEPRTQMSTPKSFEEASLDSRHRALLRDTVLYAKLDFRLPDDGH